VSIPARHELFGDPSDSLVPEAIWLFREQQGGWPAWDGAIEIVAELCECNAEEAEAQLLGVIADGDVLACIEDEDPSASDAWWFISLSEDAAANVARRYMDVNMPRKNREESL